MTYRIIQGSHGHLPLEVEELFPLVAHGLVGVPHQVDFFLHLPESQNPGFLLFSPESVRPPLLHNRLVPLVLKGFCIEHVEEVELDVDGDRRPFPGLVSGCSLPHHQLLWDGEDYKLI